MIRVIEKYHDYESTTYYIDPEKLNPENYVDSEVLKALKSKKKELSVWIDAHDWESNPKFKADIFAEPNLSSEAKVTNGEVEDRVIWLTIDFDC